MKIFISAQEARYTAGMKRRDEMHEEKMELLEGFISAVVESNRNK